ncbi:MAG: hypothetical protein V1921_04775 [Candidatus Altiarchaeota archaeon]
MSEIKERREKSVDIRTDQLPDSIAIKKPASDFDQLVSTIRGDADSKVKEDALHELRNIGADRESGKSSDAAQAIVDFVRDDTKDSRLKSGVMQDLAYVVWSGPKDSSTVAERGLVSFMNDEKFDSDTRKAAIRWLGETSSPGATSELIKFAKNRKIDSDLRDDATTSLAYIGRWGRRSEGRKAVNALVDIMKDVGEDVNLRKEVIMDVSRIGYHGENEATSLDAVTGLREFIGETDNRNLKKIARERLNTVGEWSRKDDVRARAKESLRLK